ncbi:MAG: potassium channel family protein [Chloroflexota bacterium]
MRGERTGVRGYFDRSDEYGLALLLIIATVLSLAATDVVGSLGRLVAVALGGGTLLFVLRTSHAGPRRIRTTIGIVLVAMAAAAFGLLIGDATAGPQAANIIAFALAFAVPPVILRRIVRAPVITLGIISGALCIYLLLGLIYAYLFPLVSALQGTPFFVQQPTAGVADYEYFSYTVLSTTGFGDLTAATPLGRMVAISEALLGQLFLVSAVALLVGNVGRTLTRARPRNEDADPPAG